MKKHSVFLFFLCTLLSLGSCVREPQPTAGSAAQPINRNQEAIDRYSSLIAEGKSVVFLDENNNQISNPDRAWIEDHFQSNTVDDRSGWDKFWFDFQLSDYWLQKCITEMDIFMLTTSGVEAFEMSISSTTASSFCPGTVYVSAFYYPKYLECYMAPRVQVFEHGAGHRFSQKADITVFRQYSESTQTCTRSATVEYISPSPYPPAPGSPPPIFVVGEDVNWCLCGQDGG